MKIMYSIQMNYRALPGSPKWSEFTIALHYKVTVEKTGNFLYVYKNSQCCLNTAFLFKVGVDILVYLSPRLIFLVCFNVFNFRVTVYGMQPVIHNTMSVIILVLCQFHLIFGFTKRQSPLQKKISILKLYFTEMSTFTAKLHAQRK